MSIILFSFINDSFFTVNNIINIVLQVSIITITTYGVTYVLLLDDIDLSVGSTIASTGTFVVFGASWGIPFVSLIPLSIIAVLTLGMVNGGSVAIAGIPSFTTTIATMEIFRNTVYIVTDDIPIMIRDDTFSALGNGEFLYISIPVWILIILLLTNHFVLTKTTFGQKIYITGGNKEAAIYSRIDITRLKIKVLMVIAVLAGTSGMILASYLYSGQPDSALSYELDAIAAIVLGGTSLNGDYGTVARAATSALAIGAINNSMNLMNVPYFYRMVVKELVILITVYFDVRDERKRSWSFRGINRVSKAFTIGEILVEVMASKIGQPLNQPDIWDGPYPSGTFAIFIDQVTRPGVLYGIISCVGNNGFGDINIHRLAVDGVDIRGVSVLPLEATGSTFVTYHNSSDRDFTLNIKNTACGRLSVQHIDENILKGCTCFHIMGSSLSSFHVIDAAKKAVAVVKANSDVISFDPNIRKEVLDIPEIHDVPHFVLELTDIRIPSEGEVLLLSSHSTPERAIAGSLEKGVREVIAKRGSQGASYYPANKQPYVENCPVEEVDPTSVGDYLSGVWAVCCQLGFDAHRALQYVSACGTLAATRRGPVEETSCLMEMETFIQRYDIPIREIIQ